MSRTRKRDPLRNPNRGKAVAASNPNFRNRSAVLPPNLKPGQVRCPSCLNGARLNPSGSLRRHRDLYGETCWNRDHDGLPEFPTPPVVVPPTPTGYMPRPKSEPARLDVGTGCRECGKWLPGERSLCGACYVKREASR